MNTNIKSIGFKLGEEENTFVEKKLSRLSFASEYLHNLDLTFTKPEKNSSITAAATLHFSWGTFKQVECTSYDFMSAVDELIDKLERTCRMEKEKKLDRK